MWKASVTPDPSKTMEYLLLETVLRCVEYKDGLLTASMTSLRGKSCLINLVVSYDEVVALIGKRKDIK